MPGRLERVPGPRGPTVLVDYAHTPDALHSVLAAVSEIAVGAVWVVFGCGGDRDAGKRPEMGRAAEQGADRVVVTSDNPRSENPDAIIADVVSGTEGVEVHRIADRRQAIQAAILGAADDDVVLVLGKGHERSQEIGDRVMPFDDRVVSRAAIERRRGHSR